MSKERPAAGLDVGTCFLVACRDAKEGKSVVYNTVRDCYRVIPNAEEFADQLKEQGANFLVDGDRILVLGHDAFLQASMAEFATKGSADAEILHRPMAAGILNPDSPKTATLVLRELVRVCLESAVGKAREGEVLYFSVPANPIDSKINNTFHSKTLERFLAGMGYDAKPLGEGLAVVLSENPKMHVSSSETVPFTGLGISLGAGQANFCIAERGMALDEFSIARSGDWIDQNAARMTGQPVTKVMRIKEKKLDFNKLDESDEIIMALDCYYTELIEYVFRLFGERFAANKGSIDCPIDVILSGGTAMPKGLPAKVEQLVAKMKLPFEIKEIRCAKNMLQSVATGCWLKAKQAAKRVEKA